MSDKNDLFTPHNFFDITHFSYADFLKSDASVWEVLSQLPHFIEEQFRNGRVKGNYAEKVSIGSNTNIGEFVSIQGPTIIGDNCEISHGAYIRGNCILGDNVTIGHSVELKNCIVLNNSHISHLNYIGDSVVGNNVNISGGAILANLRLDRKPVTVNTSTGKIETNLIKFGSIIGDNSQIGVNAVLNPGTILGKNCIVFPLTSVRGYHSEGSRIR